jgi:hypothetical protein
MKVIVWHLLDRLCWLTHDIGGCGWLNPEFLLFYDPQRDDFRLTIPSPTYRLWVWANR